MKRKCTHENYGFGSKENVFLVFLYLLFAFLSSYDTFLHLEMPIKLNDPDHVQLCLKGY